MKIVLATGGFDPLHSGHIEYFKSAKTLGNILIVGINSDEWLIRKKGFAFMSWNERKTIISSLSMVDYVIDFDDTSNNSVDCIQKILKKYPNDNIIFANGGDRDQKNVPEVEYFHNNSRVEFVYEVGGSTKINSSSAIVENVKSQKIDRPWGHYKTIYVDTNSKVKELTVKPNMSLSMQRHFKRNEFWHIVDGIATVELIYPKNEIHHKTLHKHSTISIPKTVWHKLQNKESYDLKIIEIQYGSSCIEEDIERKLDD